MAIFIVLLVVLVVIGGIAILTYNGLVSARNRCGEAFSGIDVQLKRRADLIPNLVESVKGYASHEQETLQALTEARSRTLAAKSIPEKAVAAGMMSSALTGFFGLAEAYPQLRAVESFMQLQVELTNTEDQISAARRIYNGNVQAYNTKIQAFPGVLFAGPFNFTAREFFELENPADRETPTVSF